MSIGRLALVAAAVVIGTAMFGVTARGEAKSKSRPAAGDKNGAIAQAFDEEVGRKPSPAETRRYRSLMDEYDWTEDDVRDDLRERPDYRRRSGESPEKVVRRAYDDILQREPDPEGMRHFRSLMIDEGWSERDVREALRDSEEYARVKAKSAEKIVRRAYKDVLGREPDANGLATFRIKILDDGWDEHDVRKALTRSPEYRQRLGQVSRQQAEQTVRQVYRDVLGREPDPGGMKTFADKVLNERWTGEDVSRELRKSPEYLNKRR